MDGPRRPFPPSVNLFCLVLTFLTTTIAGTLMSRPDPLSSSLLVDVLTRPRSWIEGLGYSLPVLFILGAHEMGHYLACRYYRIDASLPFFLPGPNLFGTFGAVIRIRAPFTNRRALFDIGIAGPLAGFAAAIPVLWHGLTHATVGSGPPVHGTILLPSCLLLSWVYPLFFPEGAELAVQLPGTFAAAWLGLFATFLNLLPIGQADGGHMLYALSPRAHSIASRAGVLVLCGVGLYFGGFHLILFGVLFAFFGPRHPRPIDNLAPLGPGRWALALLGLVIFVLCFMPHAPEVF